MDSLWSIGLTQLMPLTANYINGWATDSARACPQLGDSRIG
jgi:hypothetical protein